MYERVYLPSHPRADITGNVAKYVLVMEEVLGRPLKKGELVHHCDFDKSNDDPPNLLAMSRKEHQQLPRYQARFIIMKGLYEEFLIWWRNVRIVETSNRLEEERSILEELKAITCKGAVKCV